MKRRMVVHTSKASVNGTKTAVLDNGEVIQTKITTGKNLLDKSIKRGYLKHDEMNNFLVIHVMSQLISGRKKAPTAKPTDTITPMWEEWSERGIMTKEQKKNLKTAFTYLRKFVDDVFDNNLDIKTKDNIVRKSANWAFRLMDDYTVQKLYAMLDRQKDICITTDEFYDLLESKMHLTCNGCTKNRCECEFHTFLESKFVPPMNERLKGEDEINCEYAYKK